MTLRFYFLPVRMAEFNNTRDSLMVVRLWNKRHTHPLLGGVQIIQPLWKSEWRFLRSQDLLQDSALPPLGTYPVVRPPAAVTLHQTRSLLL